jgi:hypothetical protein
LAEDDDPDLETALDDDDDPERRRRLAPCTDIVGTAGSRAMTDNKDIAVLAKKVYELSVLPVDALDARKWEALLILNAVYSSATPAGIDKANADKVARWGAAIEQEGILSRMHPKWHLRTDDGKPPAARHALESALTNPARDLRARLATLQFIAPADRPPLEDLARALISDAFNGAKGEARDQYLDIARSRGPNWFREPWPLVLPLDGGSPPVMLLIDNQGATHDGGIYDDPRRRHPVGPPQLGQRRPHLERRLPPRQPARPALHDDRGRRGPRSSRPPARSPRAPTRPPRASPPCSNGPRMSSRASAPSVPPRSCSPR